MIPEMLVEMLWWMGASLLAISIGTSVIISFVKELIRHLVKLKDNHEKLILRLIAVIIASVVVGTATWYPFDTIPVVIKIFCGIAAGAHTEMIYQWVIKGVEHWIKKKFGKEDIGH